MGLRDIESTLPPGFRFYPSDQELVCHYLYNKVTANRRAAEGTMVEVDLHTREPWELPEVAKLSENEWYFFSFRDRKYATGLRTNRATKSGYWKATGKDRTVYRPKTRAVVGMRKTLVFYSGRAPHGVKTAWVMHEFRLENPHTPPKEDWVLCRVFNKKKGTASPAAANSAMSHESAADPLECISPPPLIDQVMMPEGCYDLAVGPQFVPHHHDGSGSASFLNLAVLRYDFLDFPQDVGPTPMIGAADSAAAGGGANEEDEYGFLLDVDLQDDDRGFVGAAAAAVPGTPVNGIHF